jgi:hypothetical protein
VIYRAPVLPLRLLSIGIRMNPIIIIVLAMWSLGAAAFAAAFSQYDAANTLIEQGIKAEGTVVNHERRSCGRGSTSKCNSPVVQFRDRNSRRIEFVSEEVGNVDLYTVGQKVEILYLPEKPERAVINDYHSLWRGVTIWVGAGCLVFLLGAVVYRLGRPPSSAKEKRNRKGEIGRRRNNAP